MPVYENAMKRFQLQTLDAVFYFVTYDMTGIILMLL